MKRIMGTETEYGIKGGDANAVVRAYNGGKSEHANYESTNESVLPEHTDIGGHIGGDYGSITDQLIALHKPRRGRSRSGYTLADIARPVVRAVKNTFSSASGPDDIIDNGARFYVDMGHPEYSTPEASNPRDAVIVDKAGERIIDAAARKAGTGITIFKNNSDGQGNSYGCHENYLMQRVSESDFKDKVIPGLLPFFVTRQIFAGNGKIGVENPNDFFGYSWASSFSGTDESKSSKNWSSYKRQQERTLDAIQDLQKYFLDMPEFGDLEKVFSELCAKRKEKGEQAIYQLSQRADFFQQLVGLGTTSNRPIINTRDEPHADSTKYMRLHVICGDANMSEVAGYLKMGTTALVLDLIEQGIAPKIELENPVRQIQQVSLDQTRKWNLKLTDGKTTTAIDIQRQYLDAAKLAYAHRDSQTDQVLDRWEYTLDALASDPMKLATSIDWVIKLNLLGMLMEKYGTTMIDPRIQNAALQYHDIDKDKGLFYYLQNNGLVERLVSDDEIAHAIHHAPEDTRAYLRSQVGKLKDVSSIDWGGFRIKVDGKSKEVRFKEPFAGTKAQVGYLFENKASNEEILAALSAIEGIKVDNETFVPTTHYPQSYYLNSADEYFGE